MAKNEITLKAKATAEVDQEAIDRGYRSIKALLAQEGYLVKEDSGVASEKFLIVDNTIHIKPNFQDGLKRLALRNALASVRAKQAGLSPEEANFKSFTKSYLRVFKKAYLKGLPELAFTSILVGVFLHPALMHHEGVPFQLPEAITSVLGSSPLVATLSAATLFFTYAAYRARKEDFGLSSRPRTYDKQEDRQNSDSILFLAFDWVEIKKAETRAAELSELLKRSNLYPDGETVLAEALAEIRALGRANFKEEAHIQKLKARKDPKLALQIKELYTKRSSRREKIKVSADNIESLLFELSALEAQTNQSALKLKPLAVSGVQSVGSQS